VQSDQQVEVRRGSDGAKNDRLYGSAPRSNRRVSDRPADRHSGQSVAYRAGHSRGEWGIAGFAIVCRSGEAFSASPSGGLKHPRFCM
jgi:hypothetical protein